MRLLSLFLLATVLALTTACGGGRSDGVVGNRLAELRQEQRIRIGVKTADRPFGFQLAGRPAGFDVDIATAVATRLGIEEIEWVPVTSATRIDQLVAGEVDMLVASMTITRSRSRLVDFSLPYFQDGQGLLVGPQSTINGYHDLAGQRVGAVAGSTSVETIAQVAPDAIVVPVADTAALAAALHGGKVDAVTSDAIILLGLASPGERLAGASFTVEPYGIAVPENESDLRNAIDVALQDLWESGEYRLIYQTWFGPGTRYHGHVSFTMVP
ncbi:MAG: transporter substrate-binding domain-containing protein, partial [Planctomycetota bacterium]